jgi:hypothetical protein
MGISFPGIKDNRRDFCSAKRIHGLHDSDDSRGMATASGCHGAKRPVKGAAGGHFPGCGTAGRADLAEVVLWERRCGHLDNQ